MLRHLFTLLCIFSIIFMAYGKKTGKYEEDFEFIDEDDPNNNYQPPSQKFSMPERKKWIRDPSNDLCKPLNCKKKELCLLEDAFTAVCISKKEFYKNRSETKFKYAEKEAILKARIESTDTNITQNVDINDDDLDSGQPKSRICERCPDANLVVSFICGSDDKTYSSLCQLDYQNCLKGTNVKVSYTGFCNNNKQTKASRIGKSNVNQKSSKKGGEKWVKTSDYTPEDIKYKNNHYKLVKFSSDFLQKHSMNDDESTVECKPQQFSEIGNRLLDWFSVIMSDSKSSKKKNIFAHKFQDYGLETCKYEAQWMFNHLDSNNDKALSRKELYNLEHDQNEACIKPFLDKVCDTDQNGIINLEEWCSCFETTDRPCIALKRALKQSEGRQMTKSYVPDCDNEGFYSPLQCHPLNGVCWCVDKHGVEFANTRSRSNQLNCEHLLTIASVGTSDDEDDDFSEGSAGN